MSRGVHYTSLAEIAGIGFRRFHQAAGKCARTQQLARCLLESSASSAAQPSWPTSESTSVRVRTILATIALLATDERGRPVAMTKRQMHLVAYSKTGPTARHVGAWRHPEDVLDDFLKPSRYAQHPRPLDDASLIA